MRVGRVATGHDWEWETSQHHKSTHLYPRPAAAAAAAAAAATATAACTQVTPFLLERVRSLTGGRSLAANILLVKNNARVGAAVAAAYAEQQQQQGERGAVPAGLRSKL